MSSFYLCKWTLHTEGSIQVDDTKDVGHGGEEAIKEEGAVARVEVTKVMVETKAQP